MGRVVLHVGLMKTGTSYIQTVLQQNQQHLQAAGFSFLANSFGRQSRAVREALQRGPSKGSVRWRRLGRAAVADERTSIVSMEFLSFAGDRTAQRIIDALEGAEVDVVLTLRDGLRVLPAQWQTYCRNQGTSAWSDYLVEVARAPRPGREPTRAYKTFHRAQDGLGVLERWRALTGVRSVHVVTVPASGAPRELLWRRFSAAVGLPEGAIVPAVTEDNSSLGYASCEYLRRANGLLADVAPADYRPAMRDLARRVLAPRRALESRPQLSRSGAQLGRSLNRGLRTYLEAGSVPVHGDLADLAVPEDLAGFPGRAAPPSPQEVLDAAGAVWTHLAEATGPTASQPPTSLDDVVSESTRMLRRLHGWTAPE